MRLATSAPITCFDPPHEFRRHSAAAYDDQLSAERSTFTSFGLCSMPISIVGTAIVILTRYFANASSIVSGLNSGNSTCVPMLPIQPSVIVLLPPIWNIGNTLSQTLHGRIPRLASSQCGVVHDAGVMQYRCFGFAG